MDVKLNLEGRRILVVGEARAARHAVARCVAAGGSITLAEPGSLPDEVGAWRELVSSVDLVVAIDGLPAHDEALLVEACAERRVWLTREPASATSPIGHVSLVGGGPGDGALLTGAARSALRSADTVFYDRLGPHDDLAEWAPGAETVDVGKTPGHHSVPQREIESMIVGAALSGKTVVRLKGGDPFVFGRGGEEAIACRAAGVPVSVISGVTSAISVPAAAGIPVTHRDVSRLFTVVSGHAPLAEDELAHLAGLGGTIVVLMGVATLPQLTSGLARNGMRRDMPVAIIERGFSPSQRTTVSTLDEVVLDAGRTGVQSPAVVVIGEVVRLSHGLDAASTELRRAAAATLGPE
jgi:uroporphyrin-III C-methyltransferase